MIRERLLQLIGQHKIDQAVIARGTGLTQATISRIISGDIENPSIETVKSLAEFFKVSVDYLIGKVDDRFMFMRERQVITFITGAVVSVDIQGYLDFLKSTELKKPETEEARKNVIAVVEKVLELKRDLRRRFPGVLIPIDWSKN